MTGFPNGEGAKHVETFLNDIDKWTGDVVENVSADRLKEIWHDCVNVDVDKTERVQVPDKLFKRISVAVSDSTKKYVRHELSEALEDNEFDAKCQLLCELKEKYKGAEPAWRPPYDAYAHMRSARVKAKQKQLEQLDLLISIKKERNSKLKSLLLEKNASTSNMSSLIEQIDKSIHSCANASNRLNSLVRSSDDIVLPVVDCLNASGARGRKKHRGNFTSQGDLAQGLLKAGLLETY